jgi:hypothetical protein
MTLHKEYIRIYLENMYFIFPHKYVGNETIEITINEIINKRNQNSNTTYLKSI